MPPRVELVRRFEDLERRGRPGSRVVGEAGLTMREVQAGAAAQAMPAQAAELARAVRLFTLDAAGPAAGDGAARSALPQRPASV